MAQWFNKEFFSNIRLLFDKDLLTPNMRVSHLQTINYDILIQKNIKGCIFDVNQTLMPYDTMHVSKEVISAITIFKKYFVVCALSNYAGTGSDDRAMTRASIIENEAKINVVRISRKKPDPEAFLRATRELNLRPNECAMIGDRLFTDIVGANKLNMFTILVNPINPSTDPLLYVGIPRRIEMLILRMFRDNEAT